MLELIEMSNQFLTGHNDMYDDLLVDKIKRMLALCGGENSLYMRMLRNVGRWGFPKMF